MSVALLRQGRQHAGGPVHHLSHLRGAGDRPAPGDRRAVPRQLDRAGAEPGRRSVAGRGCGAPEHRSTDHRALGPPRRAHHPGGEPDHGGRSGDQRRQGGPDRTPAAGRSDPGLRARPAAGAVLHPHRPGRAVRRRAGRRDPAAAGPGDPDPARQPRSSPRADPGSTPAPISPTPTWATSPPACRPRAPTNWWSAMPTWPRSTTRPARRSPNPSPSPWPTARTSTRWRPTARSTPGSPPIHGDPTLAANQLLANLSFIHFENAVRPGSPRRGARPARGWRPSTVFVSTLLAGLANSQSAEPGHPGPAVRPGPGRRQPGPGLTAPPESGPAARSGGFTGHGGRPHHGLGPS